MNRKGLKTIKEKFGEEFFKDIRKKNKNPGAFKTHEGLASAAAKKRWEKWRRAQEK